MSGSIAEQFSAFWCEKANTHQRLMLASCFDATRNLIVERQQGTTMGIAAEAIVMALETGRIQLFVAPTQPQAMIIKGYARHLADEFCKSNPLALIKDAVRDVVRGFRFASPKTAVKWLDGVVEFDLYLGDWLFMPESDVELMRAFALQYQPKRSTLVTALPQTPRFEMLKGASFFMGLPR